MRAMLADPSTEASQFRVTLFVGPQLVEGKPFTHSTVFNVKKRSWKGGIQIAVEIDQPQIESIRTAVGFSPWLANVLLTVSTGDRSAYEERAHELFIQAICWCKLDLLLHSAVTQENQCLPSGAFVADLEKVVPAKQAFITAYVATELDLLPNDTAPSS